MTKHVGKVHRRSGSGSKWENVTCSCGWREGGNGRRHDDFERAWWAHIRALGGKVPKVEDRSGLVFEVEP